MYLEFFGLNEKPFAITPDPRYLYMSARHGEGLAHLVYGVTESGGFIQLTGEVGTGKTTLVRTLLGQLPSEVDVALILNPQLSALEFLQSICDELKVSLPAERNSPKALIDALNAHLLTAHAAGRRTILLVDEAQNLDEDVLEQVRLLTNLETAKQKLLQIILIGQPELRELLAQNNLRQLAQRVTGRYHLTPLTRDETADYIEHRLRVAGALTEVFEPAAKRAVHRLSGGIPRLVNVICDRALLGAYSEENRHVTPRIVRRAAREVAGNASGGGRRRGWLAGLAGLGAVGAAVVVAAMLYPPGPLAPEQADAGPAATAAATPDVQSQQALPAEAPATVASTEITAQSIQDTVAPPPPQLPDIFAAGPHTIDKAVRVLFGLWGLEFDPGAGTACEQAAAAGLSCLYQRGSLGLLRRLDRPALLTLTDLDGNTQHAVLTAAGDTHVELTFGDDPVAVDLTELDEYWFGQYLLLWRPPNGNVVALGPGARGPQVRWLRDSLATLDPQLATPADDADYFDDELAAALREFQRRHRLQVDGLAGQQTQILINSLLAADNTPRLNDDGA